jgi:hypothetical protein
MLGNICQLNSNPVSISWHSDAKLEVIKSKLSSRTVKVFFASNKGNAAPSNKEIFIAELLQEQLYQIQGHNV